MIRIDRVAISRAVVTWALSGRPEALRKTVLLIPSSRARCVIMRAKFDSVPPNASPTTTATSLAERTTRALIASSTVILLPADSHSFEAGMEAAWEDTGSD